MADRSAPPRTDTQPVQLRYYRAKSTLQELEEAPIMLAKLTRLARLAALFGAASLIHYLKG